MKKLLFVFALMIGLISCGHTTSNNSGVDSTSVDSVLVVDSISIDSINAE